MAKANATWAPLPHQPIEKLAENLWHVQGSLPRMTLRRGMTLVRLGDGRILVHGAIALEEAAMREIEAWGSPAVLVVPNAIHRLDAPAYKARYSTMRVFAPKGAREKIEQVIAVDATLDDFPPDDHVGFEPLGGIGDDEGAMRVRSADGVSIVLGDLVFNMDRKIDPIGFFFTTLFGSAPGPRVSRLYKMLHVKDRQALRADLERLAAAPGLVRLIVAHEKIARGPDAPAALRKAATYL
jgi:hypothetical protein